VRLDDPPRESVVEEQVPLRVGERLRHRFGDIEPGREIGDLVMKTAEPLERPDGDGVEAVIARLLDLPDVECVNVRNTEAGCFVARVDRERAA
jgi:hypothetical protein